MNSLSILEYLEEIRNLVVTMAVYFVFPLNILRHWINIPGNIFIYEFNGTKCASFIFGLRWSEGGNAIPNFSYLCLQTSFSSLNFSSL